MDTQLLDLYTDYLISSFSLTTATRLSTLLGSAISHDKITRFLSAADFTSADLWQLVKPFWRIGIGHLMIQLIGICSAETVSC